MDEPLREAADGFRKVLRQEQKHQGRQEVRRPRGPAERVRQGVQEEHQPNVPRVSVRSVVVHRHATRPPCRRTVLDSDVWRPKGAVFTGRTVAPYWFD